MTILVSTLIQSKAEVGGNIPTVNAGNKISVREHAGVGLYEDGCLIVVGYSNLKKYQSQYGEN